MDLVIQEIKVDVLAAEEIDKTLTFKELSCEREGK